MCICIRYTYVYIIDYVYTLYIIYIHIIYPPIFDQYSTIPHTSSALFLGLATGRHLAKPSFWAMAFSWPNCPSCLNNGQWLGNIGTGWWCNNHLEKCWKMWVRQWEGWHPIYEMENKSHVPNHQPGNYWEMIGQWLGELLKKIRFGKTNMFFSPTVPAKQIVLQKHSVDEKYKYKH